ncbi:MAG: dicarboxylate/amino acid:cation symporter [Planctomycetes bacterium]|nr:dicarboxylate/amino acid:cation symporter [Planctomycetota bacterium]
MTSPPPIPRRRGLALHWWILLAMVAGVGAGLMFVAFGGEAGSDFVARWIKPIGTIFLNLLRMIAVPLVLFSLVAGVAGLNDTSKLSRIGGKTIGLYLGTTAVAITIGLVIVNLVQPGSNLTPDSRQTLKDSLVAKFGDVASQKVAAAQTVDIGQQIVDIVPQNPFAALAETEMLQIVFFALLLGVGLTRLRDRAAPVVTVFQTLSDAIIEMVHLIMKIAPLGVFALLCSVVSDLGKDSAQLGELLLALLTYMITVALGLATHMFLVYALLIRFVAKVPFLRFLRAMSPAQLLAFSSSSSAATLPLTLDCVEKNVGVEEEVSSFVLPLGATINMDGTGLYQGVAAVFIATLYGIPLDLGDQLMIVLTATLASIGTAAVPGVGIVMLTIVLAQIHVPAEGIAIILGVDRPLDMMRTVLNVTGDATVATVVAASEKSLDRGRLGGGPPATT